MRCNQYTNVDSLQYLNRSSTLRVDRRAYLHWIRNVERGLVTRSEIISALDREIWRPVSEIAANVRVSPTTVLYHLRNMERERIAERSTEGGWRLSPSQQAELTEFLGQKRKRTSSS